MLRKFVSFASDGEVKRKFCFMGMVTVYKDSDTDSTVVSNLFIDEYMGDANDAQIKVYLYLLRMMGARKATSVCDIADKFNHTEKDVVRALKYWEKKQLLDLDVDEDKKLVGIRMRDLSKMAHHAQKRETTTAFVPMPAASAPAETAPAITPEQAPVAAPAFAKPAYSASQLQEFKARDNTKQLLFVAESYIGKPLTPGEIKSILFFSDELNFSDDLIDYLLQYCVDKGKKDFKYIEKVAINWAEEGITTPEEAAKKSTQYDRNYYTVMRELGKTGTPTTKEASFITRWLKEYGFSIDIIIEACERTVMTTDKNRFEYAEGILKSWYTRNVHYKSDIEKIDAQHKQKKNAAGGTARSAKTDNRFNQFEQNTYDFDSLEKELLTNYQ